MKYNPILHGSAAQWDAQRKPHKGGGGGGGTSVTQQNIPNELKPLAKAYTTKAIDLSNQSYQPYTDQRYAGFTPEQNMGMNMIQNRALNGSSTMNYGTQAVNNFLSQNQTNPYLDSLVNKAQQSVMGNMAAASRNSGAFGNSGIAQSTASQMGDIASQMYGNAYNTDQANRMQALQLAPTYGNQAYTDAQQMMNVGQMQQDAAQQGLDFNYQQFQDQQNLPYKQLSAMSGVFGSNLGSSGTTTQSGGGK